MIDWTDHVWTEVYSTSQQRWMHSDGALRKDPLFYEKSWGKKFTYIVAFSAVEVLIVSFQWPVISENRSKRDLHTSYAL